ncbi:hypothetical protein BCR34DRAFT_242781 [Clohesyomyces aquaticus]|uniref:DNA polymerase lambda n=1 Tax=Clohesyomyces aquaticus TaxID=1231657 RepID=A0A1Y1Y5B6_9PLEO|nr:hypothetical protein BCR34DRAFT_242781 [Clohesyomyces aquaticus]
MSEKALEEKKEYFEKQELLDISHDDDEWSPDEVYLNTGRALADSRFLPPPPRRNRGSFLGPAPRERKAEFEAHATKQRATSRGQVQGLVQSATLPEVPVSTSFPSAMARRKPTGSAPGKLGPRKALKHSVSLLDLVAVNQAQDQIPFYKRVGVVPRPLGMAKKSKPIDIVLEPEHKQLLKGKIIYFYPNDDISQARRMRLRKLIQLGAAWVKEWRDDISHVMVEDDNYTYGQLLRRLNKLGLPKSITLVKFEPYIPQCIQFGTLLDTTLGRFLVKGAPRQHGAAAAHNSPSSPSSQVSLQVKLSAKQQAGQDSQRTDAISVKDSFPPPHTPSPPSIHEGRVKDSFPPIHSDPAEEPAIDQDPYNDALSEAIQMTKAISHLPLDEDDSDTSPLPLASSADYDSDSDCGTDVELTKPVLKRQRRSSENIKVGLAKGINQSAFQCMQPNSTNSSQDPNTNARTISILDQMCKYYDQMGDQWRTLAYRRGISTLRKQSQKITTKEEAAALPFIGTRLAEKIEEIVLTDRLRRLDSTREDPTDQTLRLFMGVYGAGLSQANTWIQSGYSTLDDLVAKAKLTDSQKIGIEHYEDFATRIPRAEVQAHGDFVRGAIARIDPGFQVTVMGSYRRGAKDSGDIDLIITKPGAKISLLRTVVFETLVPRLLAAGFLKCTLATSHRTNDGTKWLGASCLPGSRIWRRLDLLLVPESEMGASLIYFTGNDIFNRSLRLLASKKGMRLNQRGLYKDVIRGKSREKLKEGILVEGRSEKKIFEILGVPWRLPTERIC